MSLRDPAKIFINPDERSLARLKAVEKRLENIERRGSSAQWDGGAIPTHADRHEIDGNDPITPAMIDAAYNTDARFPSLTEKAALVGTEGTPGIANPYVTDEDPRFGDLSGAQGDITDLQTDVGNLQTDVGDLQTDVGDLQTDVGDLQTDVAALPTSFAADITGDSTTTDFVITHNAGTRDVLVQVRAIASPYAQVSETIEHTTTNSITVKFASAPGTGVQYRVMIIAF